ncbi:MAG: Na+/H+ antiporter NhaA [Acidobacteriaceae bacterium]|nr:Na+/H+ antiporter NhaA [Acidobacteriaceae bacterium]
MEAFVTPLWPKTGRRADSVGVGDPAVGMGRRPDGVSPPQFFGVALLTGIGFTVSLFIGDLAFDGSARAHAVRLGIVSGSLMSAR